jgi:hypothetical protein
MTNVYPANATGGASRDDEGAAAARGIAKWLGLAAAPTFAIMALLTGVLGDGKMAMMCASAPDPSSLGGMIPMYLLMSAFHLAPWLKLMASRRRRTPPTSCGSGHWFGKHSVRENYSRADDEDGYPRPTCRKPSEQQHTEQCHENGIPLVSGLANSTRLAARKAYRPPSAPRDQLRDAPLTYVI